MIRRVWSFVLTLVCISLLSCAAQKPLLTQDEMGNMANDEFQKYFLDRIDNVIVPRALQSGGDQVIKESDSWGKQYRVGSYPRGIDKNSPQFK